MRKKNESCEVCGKPEVFGVVEIEGAKLSVCRACAYGKKIIYYLEEENTGENARQSAAKQKPIEVEDIVEGYGKLIREAREKIGLPIAVLAEKIKENRRYMERIEREEVKPTLATAKKIEKELGIKLIEKSVEVAPSVGQKKKSAEPTLGDLLEEEK